MHDPSANVSASVHDQDGLLEVDRPAPRLFVHVAPLHERIVQHRKQVAKPDAWALAMLGGKVGGLS